MTEEIEFHLLFGFMVAWAGHVGHIRSYGLDLSHEFITNPGIILEQAVICMFISFWAADCI